MINFLKIFSVLMLVSTPIAAQNLPPVQQLVEPPPPVPQPSIPNDPTVPDGSIENTNWLQFPAVHICAEHLVIYNLVQERQQGLLWSGVSQLIDLDTGMRNIGQVFFNLNNQDMSWTMVISFPDGVSCIMAVGSGFNP